VRDREKKEKRNREEMRSRKGKKRRVERRG